MENQKAQIYHVNLSVAGLNFDVDGNTIRECFDKFVDVPTKGRAILTVKKGDLSAQKILFPRHLRRFLAIPLLKSIIAKNMELSLR